MTELVVKEGEVRSFRQTWSAYELSIEISEKAIVSAKKEGLIFEEYCTSLPEGINAYALGIGQEELHSF